MTMQANEGRPMGTEAEGVRVLLDVVLGEDGVEPEWLHAQIAKRRDAAAGRLQSQLSRLLPLIEGKMKPPAADPFTAARAALLSLPKQPEVMHLRSLHEGAARLARMYVDRTPGEGYYPFYEWGSKEGVEYALLMGSATIRQQEQPEHAIKFVVDEVFPVGQHGTEHLWPDENGRYTFARAVTLTPEEGEREVWIRPLRVKEGTLIRFWYAIGQKNNPGGDWYGVVKQSAAGMVLERLNERAYRDQCKARGIKSR